MAKSPFELSTEITVSAAKTPIRVLHVDDEQAFLKVSQECLQLHGEFEIDTASSVREATEKMMKRAYDAVVCDYQMPGKDGLQFLADLRESGNRIPFILFTGRGREEVAVKAINLGVNGYINKTGSPEVVYCELAHSIRQAVEQAKAADRLKASEEKYRSLFENANNAILLLDLKGNIIDVNKTALEYGFRREELIGRNVIEFVSWKEKLRLIKEVAKKAKGKSVEGKIEINTPKGKFLADYISKPVIVNNRVIGIQTILSRVTEQKELTAMYQAVFENTSAATCIIEEDMTISLVNKEFEKLSGYSKKEIEGKKKWTEFVTKEYVEKIKECQERRMKSGEVPTIFNAVNKKGEIRNVLVTVGVIPRTKKIVASLIDITEQKKSKEQLRKLEENYQCLFEQAPISIVIFDVNGVVKSVNAAATRMSGFSKEEMVGKNFSELNALHQNDIQGFTKLHDCLLKGVTPKPFEMRYFRKDGSVAFGEVYISLIKEQDTISGFQAMMIDVTERKEAEEKMNKLMNDLMLVNEKLNVVGKWARHDARNKLSVIKNNVYLAKKKLPSHHPVLEYLNEIDSACAQITQIFDFAATYEMLGVEERSYVDVEKTFEEAVSLVSGVGNVKIANKCRGLMVYADAQLRQLFYNLIDNSLKHGEKVSQITLYYKVDEASGTLKLIYEDDGVGIPDEVRPNLFREGFGKNTGYGLYLINKLCKFYGWHIQETGRMGKGAQFTITIPKVNEKAEFLYKFQK